VVEALLTPVSPPPPRSAARPVVMWMGDWPVPLGVLTAKSWLVV